MKKEYLDELLKAWEETYKKGQLTLWIFLSLREGPKYVEELRDSIEKLSAGTIACEEMSLYRTLRKFHHLGIVQYTTGKGNKGPERKYYELTSVGTELLQAFVDRNIRLFFNHELKNLLNIKEDAL
ncbi:MAG: PadR family transcriptional regulator [Bacteroidales bacterium]